MSCIHITTHQLASLPSSIPAKALQHNTISICPKKVSLKLTRSTSGTRFARIFPKLTPATFKHQKTAIVCSSGGGKSQGENQGSPWEGLEKAVGNFRKDASVEDLLRQQIQKREFYDGGDGGSKPPGGGGGGGGGFGSGEGEGEDEGLWGVLDEFAQVILATSGFIFLYIYILHGEDINVITKDFLRFIFKRRKSIRLKRLLDRWNRFFESMRDEGEYEDPYWLERAIINTPTCYDHPVKYKWLIKFIESNSGGSSKEE